MAAKKHSGTSWFVALLPAVSPYSLSALFCLLYLYADTMQSCLTPFKCVNKEALELYAIIFDALYGSSILSSLLSTLDITNEHGLTKSFDIS